MRALNRLVSALLALAVIGAGGLAAAEVFVARVHWGWLPGAPLVVPYDTWLKELRAHHWSDTIVLVGSIGGIVAGLVLLSLAASAKERRIQMDASHPEIDLSTSRRSLARVLAHDAEEIEGVGGASAGVRNKTAKVRARLRLGDPDEVREAVRARAQARLDSLPLRRRPKLSVDVSDSRRYK